MVQKVYVQGFYCENISLKKGCEYFDRMEIAESVYEGVVPPFYKKLLDQNPTVLDSVGIMDENPPRKTLTLKRMIVLARAVNDM